MKALVGFLAILAPFLVSSLPTRNPDGTCSSYIVAAGDTCWTITQQSSNQGLTVAQIESFNAQTWGWSGCGRLFSGARICLSSGTPPMPTRTKGAICGPQAEFGSQTLAPGQSVASLNPCPLNACCNIWGQCGISDAFCTPSAADSGAPGTAAPGQNGCISNCFVGFEMLPSVRSNVKPAVFARVGYFEAFNTIRPCLTMQASTINMAQWSHVHFAFAGINPNGWTVDLGTPDIQAQFVQFKQLPSSTARKILTIGGWAFSTDSSTVSIFPQAVSAANRQQFANNVVSFITANGLDGVDFDWEYPGGTGLPGLPAGDPNDGANFLAFLKLVRAQLPQGKTVAIAAPASYWYLRAFPIADMASVLDYIVFMTYDLHGQWDYGSPWSDDGCPTGDCLRSHVNFTETYAALAMVAKAGVPPAKVMVGVSSYGRSFGMTQPGCTGPNCHYVGPTSGATPGPCTGTAGYISDLELGAIAANSSNGGVQMYRDDSMSDIMVYGGGTQWVAYTRPDNKKTRASLYQSWGFGGTADWALDLEAGSLAPDDGIDDALADWCDSWQCVGNYRTLEDIKAMKDAGAVTNECAPMYVVQALGWLLTNATTWYSEILESGYDTHYDYYRRYVNTESNNKIDEWMSAHANEYFDCYLDRTKDGLGWPHVDCNYYLVRQNEIHVWADLYFYNKTDWLPAMQNATGVPQSWVYTGDYREFTYDPDKLDDLTKYYYWLRNWPMVYDWAPGNPKSQLSKTIPQLQVQGDQLTAIAVLARYNLYDGNLHDVIDTIKMTVFGTLASLDNLQSINDLGAEEEKKQIEQVVFLVLDILCFVAGFVAPVLEGVAAAFEGMELAGTVATFIDGTATAITVTENLYKLVEDPKSWRKEIADLGIAVLGLGFKGLGKAAKISRLADSAGTLAKYGEKMSSLAGVTKSIIQPPGVDA